MVKKDDQLSPDTATTPTATTAPLATDDETSVTDASDNGDNNGYDDDAIIADAEEDEDFDRTVRDSSEFEFNFSVFAELNDSKEFKRAWKLLTKKERRAARSNLHESAQKKFVEEGATIDVYDKTSKKTYVWKWIKDSKPDNPINEREQVGVAGFDFETRMYEDTFAADVFFHMWPGNPRNQLQNMNHWISTANKLPGTRVSVRLATEREYYTFIAIIIAASGYTQKGKQLWQDDTFSSFFKSPKFGEQFRVTYHRFEQLKKYFVYAFCDSNADKSADKWWMIRGFVDGYNENREKYVASGFILILDESMSAWCPQTTKTGGLPHISFILRKPEPLGTEFKVAADSATEIFTHLEIQEGKEPMRAKSVGRLGATASCTHRLAKAAACCGPTAAGKRSLVLRDSWFGSYACVVSLKRTLGHESMLCIKTGHSKTPKLEMDAVMRHWPAGSYAVLTHTCEGRADEADVELVLLSYKYNCRRVLHFLMTKDAGSTVPDPSRPYIARFPDRFGNVHERPVARPLSISIFFDSSNIIDSHNHKRQFELALEKRWIVKGENACWFRLDTTLIGMNLVDSKVRSVIRVFGIHSWHQ